MFLSVLNKNLYSKSLTKNLVTFNFDIMGVRWRWGTRTKKGETGQFVNLRSGGRGPGEKEEGGVF